jgi:succinyl-CoA synthetase alpha subunit
LAIIAEGVPEHRTKIINAKAKQKGVTIIGPATVGGIKVDTEISGKFLKFFFFFFW